MVLIMKSLKASGLMKEMLKAFKILRSEEHFIKDILKTLYNAISPGFSYGDKDGLDAQFKAKPDYQSKRVRIAIAAAGR